MARKRKSSKGFGFSPEVREVKDNYGYQTIFEKLVEKADGKKRTFGWYKNALQSYTDQVKVMVDERADESDEENKQDENALRLKPLRGHLYFFEYEAKSRWLPYYDKFPLVYMMSTSGTHFYGANLHYIAPKKRVSIINDLKMGKVNLPKGIIHKYLKSHVKSFYLDLAEPEWETSILIPVENFVSTKNKVPYDSEKVWLDNEKGFYDRVKGTRIIKEYAN